MRYIQNSPPRNLFHGTTLVAQSRRITLLPAFCNLSTVMIELRLSSDTFCTLNTVMIELTSKSETFRTLTAVMVELSLRFDS